MSKRISELPAAGPLTGNEIYPVVQNAETRAATVEKITDFVRTLLDDPDADAFLATLNASAIVGTARADFSVTHKFVLDASGALMLEEL